MPETTITRVSPVDTARSFGVGHYRAAYEKGINVTQLLERDDPSSEYAANDPDRHLDAFERVLKASGLRVAPVPEYGIRASTWEEANQTVERRAMLHELCARIWRAASRWQEPTPQTRAVLLSGDAAVNSIANVYSDDTTIRAKQLAPPIPLDAIVARTTPIDGDAYRSLYITDDLGTDAYRMKRVTEGTEIPRTTLVTGEHTLRIGKFGRALLATYEQLRRQRLDRIAFIVQRMALQAQVDKATDALGVIVSGDGNANTAATVLTLTSLDAAAVAGTLTLKGYMIFKTRFTPAYVADTIIGQEASIAQLLLLPINTVNGMPYGMIQTGAFGTMRPINDQLSGGIRYGIDSTAPALKLVAFDSSLTVEQVVEIGGDVSEVERYITNQTQILTMTESVGFAILDPYAARVLNINA
jgi:hypothetical protein